MLNHIWFHPSDKQEGNKSMINLHFFGAAQTTTGSMHMVECNGKKVLMDCGLLQGKRKESFEANRNLPFNPREIAAIILSHAHIDHCGKIPALVRQGYRGPIYSTPATRDLVDVLLRDSAFLQEKDVEFVNKRRSKQGKNLFELLYDQADVDAICDRTIYIDCATYVGSDEEAVTV